MKIEIWNRKDKLKNLEKEVWFESYPQAKFKTLVLVDDSEVLFLEDINCKNEEDVKQYIEDRKKEEIKEKSEVELLKEKINEQEERITVLSDALNDMLLDA